MTIRAQPIVGNARAADRKATEERRRAEASIASWRRLTFLGLVLLTLSAGACCSGHAAAKDGRTALGEWDGKILWPFEPGTCWGFSEWGCGYRVASKELERTAPYPSDAEAAAAAVTWLAKEFGLAEDSLACAEVKATNSDGRPDSWWRNGHTVVIRQVLHRMPVDTGGVVFLSGRTVRSADVQLYGYTRRAGPASKCIGEQEAVAAAASFLTARGFYAPYAKGPGLDPHPELVFDDAFTQFQNTASEQGRRVFSPVWKFRGDAPVVVDAVSGAVIIDD